MKVNGYDSLILYIARLGAVPTGEGALNADRRLHMWPGS
jgi:hypothetical protein